MQRRVSSALLFLGLASALCLGCLGQAQRPAFYTLSPGSGPALASRPELGLAIGPLEFPRYLDRPEIVTRDGSHRLIVADAHRWGGSLRTDILRAMADDLGRFLGTSRVAIYPNEPRFLADYRILLDVREFEGVLGDSVRLRMGWTIVPLAGGEAVAVEESRVEQPIGSASFDDLVAAQSAALSTVSRRIAERVAELPAR